MEESREPSSENGPDGAVRDTGTDDCVDICVSAVKEGGGGMITEDAAKDSSDDSSCVSTTTTLSLVVSINRHESK